MPFLLKEELPCWPWTRRGSCQFEVERELYQPPLPLQRDDPGRPRSIYISETIDHFCERSPFDGPKVLFG
jgi:hypothetical protein